MPKFIQAWPEHYVTLGGDERVMMSFQKKQKKTKTKRDQYSPFTKRRKHHPSRIFDAVLGAHSHPKLQPNTNTTHGP